MAVQGHVTVCLLVYDTDTCVAVGTVCTWILWLCPSAHECVCTVTICTWALWLCPLEHKCVHVHYLHVGAVAVPLVPVCPSRAGRTWGNQ